MPTLSNYINGKFVPPVSGQYIDGVSPITGKVTTLIPDSDSRDAEQALNAANEALSGWRDLSPQERSGYLKAVVKEMRLMEKELIETESKDMGKPVMFMANDFNQSCEEFELFSNLILTESLPYYPMKEGLAIEHMNAIGVCGLITPWNFPLMLFCKKVAPCIATGNTCVCKPSELSPNTAYLMCKIFDKVGIPKGVVNVIHGYGPKAGQPIVESDIVRAVSFTGGSVTGKTIATIAASKLKKTALELGGKNPSMVFSDCYFDETVAGVAVASLMNTGQVCCSGSRVLVERSIYDKFIKALVKHVSETWGACIGDPLLDTTMMGPLVSKQQFNKVKSYLKLAKEEGGNIVYGGKIGRDALGPKTNSLSEINNGYFVSPTIVTGLTTKCRCAQEEIFGPVLTVHVFDSEKECIEMANCVDYGLGACIWTSDIRRGQRVARQIDSGSVWINTFGEMHMNQPFGGFKNSGIGRENGVHSLRFYTEPKSIFSKL